MSISTISETNWTGFHIPAVAARSANQTERIQAALGVTGDLPQVDQDTLALYQAYLSATLSLPLTAYYPQPTNAQEKNQFRCIVLELLDPTQYLGDECDGIFCRTRKGSFEVNIPLIELHVPQDGPNFQLIEDYWYWFWNRR
ncbi:MAG: calcium-binding protein [Thermoguttaceae bacterium]